MTDKLTAKQEAFVRAYLTNGRNATAAYRTAYDCSNMSEASANVNACKLLKHAKIAPRIELVVRKACERTEISVERVLREYARIGFSDIRNFTQFGPAGITLKPDTELTDDDAAAIAEVSMVPSTGALKFKLHDKKGALDSMARNLGMFLDRTELSGQVGVTVKAEELSDDELAARIAGK